jgi:filamentous hemagglutinin family protein
MVKHRGSLRALLISTILGGFPAMPALANPTGAQVVAGGVKVRGEGTKTVVVAQSTDRAIINWRNFDIAADETTRFVQPRNESITLNRITSGQPTRILGNLQANGNVFVINGNGVVFGKGSQVNVGGLVASTADIDDRSFLRSTGQYRFDRAGDPNAEIVVDGSINVQRAGVAAFVAPRFSNSGMVRATLGRIAIGAADRFTLDMAGDGLIRFAPSDGFGRSSGGIAVENSGVLEAQSGLIEISAFAARDAINGSVRVDGMVSAGGATRNPDGSVQLSGTGGRIDIAATGAVELGKASTLDASGADGGTVRINTPGIAFLDGKITADGGNAGGAIAVSANNIASTGTLSATGGTGAGGAIAVIADNRYIATTASDIDASGAQGGSITVAGGLGTGQGLFSSGTMLANGSSQAGGAIAIHGHEINLVAATGSADGHSGGGQISVGHVRGADDKVAIGAATVELSPDTVLSASALGKGDGGRIVVWSIDLTRAWGATNARGGPVGGDGGFIELSSRGALVFGGSGDASAPLGARGTLLLDPRNLTIDDAEARFPQYQLIDPNPNAGNNFGGNVLALYTGNVVVTSVSDDFGGINAGAAYLYNLTTGGLISTLVGSSVMDSVGSAGIAVLANGNYVVRSGIWDNGSIVDASAMTFGNGVTGVSGTVSASNSLVGSTTGDNLSQNGIVTLANGNYLVRSSRWDNGSAVNAGAVTFGNGVTGTVGVVSAANSLIGSSAEDFVGAGEVIALTNGNYVVTSHSWNNGSIGDAGAVTFGDGTTGTVGTVSAANSLIGTAANDRVGSGGVVALTNGNYVVTTYLWDNGSIVDAGAVTWVNGATGLIGSISASNSLVGTTANVQVGSTGVTALTNGNYVVTSSNWGNGLVANLGAITWGNGATGIAGAVSVNNSLVGTTANDSIGAAGVTKLTNGNYVVASSTWDNGSVLNAGAVTWGNGTTGTVGTVSASNSLVGTTAGDSVGATGVTALTNGNYVVASSLWDNGSIGNAGAVTWGDGTTGITGAVSASNSLVGSTASDNVGSARLTALTNGNYVVISPVWDKGSIANAGAVTWGNGAAGTVGAVSVSNSLIGTSSNDLVGINSVLALTNGNYIVRSSNWDRGSAVNAGAVTFGNGVTGVIGPVSISNSLVGSTAGDAVGGGAIIVPDGNYVVFTSSWDNNSVINAGAVTFGDGATGTVGNISAMNSLIGSIRDSSPGYVPTAESGFILARSVTDGGSGRVYVGLNRGSDSGASIS